LLKWTKIRPEDGLFIDDDIGNVKAAEELGMKCIHYKKTAPISDRITQARG
jgi:FMN phosphatase YigB (HAD superfamily)